MKQIKASICILLSCLVIYAYLPSAIILMMTLLEMAFVQAGVIMYGLVYYTALRYGSHFWRILDHELLHSFASILCFRSVRQLHADHQLGGHVHYNGSENIFISLAPYIIWRTPVILTMIFLCAIEHVVMLKAMLFLLGVALAYAVLAIVEEAKPHQKDLKKHGLLCAYSYILAVNIVIGGILAEIAINQHLTSQFLRNGITKLNELVDYSNLIHKRNNYHFKTTL